MFAYCGNNPISREDDEGDFWNIVIGAVVGAAISSATQIVSNLITGEDWHKGVASAAIVGAVGGAVAATGLGVFAQATITSFAAATGDAVQQGIDKGFDKINVRQSIRTGLVAGATSLIGSFAGKSFLGGIDDAGQALISKGYQQNLTGIDRALRGRSHTSFFKSGAKLIARGRMLVNYYRGASSSLGSLIGIPTGLANNLIPE